VESGEEKKDVVVIKPLTEVSKVPDVSFSVCSRQESYYTPPPL